MHDEQYSIAWREFLLASFHHAVPSPSLNALPHAQVTTTRLWGCSNNDSWMTGELPAAPSSPPLRRSESHALRCPHACRCACVPAFFLLASLLPWAFVARMHEAVPTAGQLRVASKALLHEELLAPELTAVCE